MDGSPRLLQNDLLAMIFPHEVANMPRRILFLIFSLAVAVVAVVVEVVVVVLEEVVVIGVVCTWCAYTAPSDLWPLPLPG